MGDIIQTRGITKAMRTFVYLSSFLRNGDPGVMKQVGIFARDLILERTRDGKDVRGVPFQRKKDGNRSTLTQSGAMLEDLRVQSSATVIRIYMGKRKHLKAKITHHGLAMVHNEGMMSGRGSGFQMPKREFLGFSTSDIMKIRVEFKKLVHQKINQITR